MKAVYNYMSSFNLISLSGRLLILPALLVMLTTLCIGRGEFPEVDISSDDSLPGRFVRAIGPDEMRVLLNSPFDAEDPGIPINHMLYVLDRLSIDKLIDLVQGTSALKTVTLMNAIKRMGCNKPLDATPTVPNFNIPIDQHHMECNLNDYHYLDLMVELVDKTEDSEKLIALLNRESLETGAALTPDEEKAAMKVYMEKLAFVTVYLNDTDKMSEMVNGVIDPRDVVYFINQFDNEGCSNPGFTDQTGCETNGDTWTSEITVPVPVQDIIDGAQLGGLNKLVGLLRQIADSSKLYTMINGKRTAADDAAQDAAQITYIRDKVIPILEGNTGNDAYNSPAVATWVLKLSTMINQINRMDKMVDMVDLFQNLHIVKIIDLLERLNSPALAVPDNNAVNVAASLVDLVDQPSKMATLLGEADGIKMARLLNDLSASPNSRIDDSGNPDLRAAGKKIASIINGIDDTTSPHCADPAYATEAACDTAYGATGHWLNSRLSRMSHALVNVTIPEKLSGLIDFLSIANAYKMGDLVNDVNGWQNVINIMENLDSPVDDPLITGYEADINKRNAIRTMAYTLDNIDDAAKINYLIDNISNAVNVAVLVNQVAEKESTINGNTAGTAGETVPGEKMTTILSDVNFTANVVFVIDNVSSLDKMADLVVTLSNGPTGIGKVPVIINGIDNTGNNGTAPYGNTWDATAGNRGTATEMGKMVNMVDYTTSLTDVAIVLEGVDKPRKMVELINNVGNSSDMIGTLNAAISLGVLDNLVTVINTLDAATPDVNPLIHIPKLTVIINNIGNATEVDAVTTSAHADHTIMAQLMQNSGSDPTDPAVGLGPVDLATIIEETGVCTNALLFTEASCGSLFWDPSDTGAALRLAEVITLTNTDLCYQEDCSATQSISKREAMVRLLLEGIIYDPIIMPTKPTGLNESFPGLGASQLALMMNQAEGGQALSDMLNANDLMDVVVAVGCGERVGGFHGPFRDPCYCVGQGWTNVDETSTPITCP